MYIYILVAMTMTIRMLSFRECVKLQALRVSIESLSQDFRYSRIELLINKTLHVQRVYTYHHHRHHRHHNFHCCN